MNRNKVGQTGKAIASIMSVGQTMREKAAKVIKSRAKDGEELQQIAEYITKSKNDLQLIIKDMSIWQEKMAKTMEEAAKLIKNISTGTECTPEMRENMLGAIQTKFNN